MDRILKIVPKIQPVNKQTPKDHKKTDDIDPQILSTIKHILNCGDQNVITAFRSTLHAYGYCSSVSKRDAVLKDLNRRCDILQREMGI
jgi:hypothetical protein